MLLRLGDDGVDVVPVVEGEHASERVGAEVFDEGLGDRVTVGEKQLLEAGRVLEGTAVGQFSGGDDRRVRAAAGRDFLDGPPLADGVVVIPGEAQGVDLRVAGRAVRIRRMRRQFVAQGSLGTLRRGRFDGRHVGGRRRGRLAEDRLAQPHPAVDRAVARTVRAESEHGTHGQQAAAVVGGLERDPLEAFGRGGRQAVEVAEAAVRHRPVGVDESVHGKVLREHLPEVFDDLAAHAGLEPGVVVRVQLLVGREHADAVELQPLTGEVVDEAPRLRVLQHAIQLFAELGAAQLAVLGRGEQGVVRHRAPEQV